MEGFVGCFLLILIVRHDGLICEESDEMMFILLCQWLWSCENIYENISFII
jgi:hypothetical protein